MYRSTSISHFQVKFNLYKKSHLCQAFVCLCPSPTVPNLLPNMDECKNVEIRTNSCWGRTNIINVSFELGYFLDNNKITIRHVQSQVDKVRVIFANDHE